jgi:hypothetical protein
MLYFPMFKDRGCDGEKNERGPSFATKHPHNFWKRLEYTELNVADTQAGSQQSSPKKTSIKIFAEAGKTFCSLLKHGCGVAHD